MLLEGKTADSLENELLNLSKRAVGIFLLCVSPRGREGGEAPWRSEKLSSERSSHCAVEHATPDL